MLIVPLDQSGEWYRLSPVLRDVLRGRLRRGDAGAEAEIHARASRWWEAVGDVEAAVHHARLAGDIERAGALIARILPAYQLSGRTGPDRAAAGRVLGRRAAQLAGALGRDGVGLPHGRAGRGVLTTGAPSPRARPRRRCRRSAAAPTTVRGPRSRLLRAAVAAHGIAAMGADARARGQRDAARQPVDRPSAATTRASRPSSRATATMRGAASTTACGSPRSRLRPCGRASWRSSS